MNKLIIALLSLVVSTGLMFWVFIKGWGLTPQNWSVILWGAFFQFIVIALMQAGTKD